MCVCVYKENIQKVFDLYKKVASRTVKTCKPERQIKIFHIKGSEEAVSATERTMHYTIGTISV